MFVRDYAEPRQEKRQRLEYSPAQHIVRCSNLCGRPAQKHDAYCVECRRETNNQSWDDVSREALR